MEREIIYGSKKRGTWAPHYQKAFYEILFKFFFELMYKMAKAVSSSIERIFPTGVDGKNSNQTIKSSLFQKGGWAYGKIGEVNS